MNSLILTIFLTETASLFNQMGVWIAFGAAAFIIGIGAFIIKMYRKVNQGHALVRNGVGGTRVSFSGMIVVPVLHKIEVMDISLKTLEISRMGGDGLVCKDKLRADIKVAFFVRVNNKGDSVKEVAQSIGCERASHQETLRTLFDAKFSEALKSVGFQFNFEDLYNAREEFKKQILETIGDDLNGYALDDCAIDYLEQTSIDDLDSRNTLDAVGIKRITELTAAENILANQINRNEEKIITQQNVEAEEAILELNKQLEEAKAKQDRDIKTVQAREVSLTKTAQQEELKKSEKARIQTEEEVQVAEENKLRSIIIAEKSKQSTFVIEDERVKKDRELEENEREKIVAIERIKKEKAIEVEKKAIQDVIRERVEVEREVVQEEEEIKDLKVEKEALRQKLVEITRAEQQADSKKILEVTLAQAETEKAKLEAEKKLIEAQADEAAAVKRAEAKKTLAKASIEEEAAKGLAEAKVKEAKASALELEGEAEASVMEKKAIAEANGISVKADAERKMGEMEAEVLEKKGLAEATVLEKKAIAEAIGMEEKAKGNLKMGESETSVLQLKLEAEADGILKKAEAMKKLDGAGKDHEEFKLKLQMQKEIALAQINIQKEIASAQASVLAEALQQANIDIVGGDGAFFDKIVSAVTYSKSLDQFVNHSEIATEIKNQLLTKEGFQSNIRDLIQKFNVSSDDLKNLSVSALLLKLLYQANDDESKGMLNQLLDFVKGNALADKNISDVL